MVIAADWKAAQEKARRTARWAITMSKVRIRQVLARTRWQLVTFTGKAGGESTGVVDLLAIRKDHGTPNRRYQTWRRASGHTDTGQRWQCCNADDRGRKASEGSREAIARSAHTPCDLEKRGCRSILQLQAAALRERARVGRGPRPVRDFPLAQTPVSSSTSSLALPMAATRIKTRLVPWDRPRLASTPPLHAAICPDCAPHTWPE